jgi:hypothetical protein
MLERDVRKENNMKTYAGIGSRRLTPTEWDLCFRTGKWLAQQGWTLKTGACQGADQAFAEGALTTEEDVILYIPWPSYEFKWVEPARGQGAVRRILRYDDIDAYASVNKFHPNPTILSDAIKKLHARNFLIVNNTQFVIAWPKPTTKGRLGSTGQGIRIAANLGIQTIRMDEPIDRTRVETKVP